MVRPRSFLRLLLLLLLLLSAWGSATAGASASGCRWNTHSVASFSSSWPRLPPSVDLAVVQLRDGIAPTAASESNSGPTALQVLPPGLHVFLDSPVASNDVAAAGALDEQLSALLDHSIAPSTLRPLRRQFAEVAPDVAVGLRCALGFKEEKEEHRQLLWYHAHDPALALPYHEAIAALIQTEQHQENEEQDQQQQQPTAGASLMAYQLTLSAPQPRLRTCTCPAATPTTPPPSGSAELQWTAAEPPGKFFAG